MSAEFWVTIAIVGVLTALFLGTLNEALSESNRQRLAAVGRGIAATAAALHRLFASSKGPQEKEVPREPTR